MKKILILLVVLFSFNTLNAKENVKYNLYYFMSDTRCSNCYKIESWTKEVYDELDNKNIEFKIVNINKEENKKFIKDYNIYTKSVIISKIENDKEIKYQNFTKIWNYLNNKEKFKEYLKKEIENFIKE